MKDNFSLEEQILRDIDISCIENDDENFQLRSFLKDAFFLIEKDDRKYRLCIDLSFNTKNSDVQFDEKQMRYSVVGMMKYKLCDADNNLLHGGLLKEFAGYDRSYNNYATYISDEYTRENMTKIMIFNLKSRLLLFLKSHNEIK